MNIRCCRARASRVAQPRPLPAVRQHARVEVHGYAAARQQEAARQANAARTVLQPARPVASSVAAATTSRRGLCLQEVSAPRRCSGRCQHGHALHRPRPHDMTRSRSEISRSNSPSPHQAAAHNLELPRLPSAPIEALIGALHSQLSAEFRTATRSSCTPQQHGQALASEAPELVWLLCLLRAGHGALGIPWA